MHIKMRLLVQVLAGVTFYPEEGTTITQYCVIIPVTMVSSNNNNIIVYILLFDDSLLVHVINGY